MGNSELLQQMGVENPDKPVTRGEVALYVAKAILAERARLAQVMRDHKQDEWMAEAIGNDRLDDDFEWKD